MKRHGMKQHGMNTARHEAAQGMISLRPYRPSDAVPTAELFRAAVHALAGADYDAEQLAAWAPADPDLERWSARRLAVETVIAEDDGTIAGFSDIDPSGHIDMLYVHPRFARHGIATALISHVLLRARELGAEEATVEASETARPVFERAGFAVVERQEVERRSVTLHNYRMRLALR